MHGMRRVDSWANRQKVLFRPLPEQLQQQSKQLKQQLRAKCKHDAAQEPQDPGRTYAFKIGENHQDAIAPKGV